MEIKIFLLILVIFGVNSVDIPADYCRGHNEGVLPHPDPARCTEFVVCVLGNPFPFQCQPNLIFHPPAGDCLPGNPDTCELFTVTPPTTTTEIVTPPTTTTEIITTTTQVVTTTEELTTTTAEELTTTTSIEVTTEPITTTTEPVTTSTEVVTTTTEVGTTTEEVPTTTTEYTTTAITEVPTTTTITDGPITITTTAELITTTTPLQTTTGPDITTTTQRPLGPPELCVGNNMRNVADPEYCFRFYWCMLGIAFPGECAPDRIFSERWRGCVLGDWDTCIPARPISPWNFKVVKINKKIDVVV